MSIKWCHQEGAGQVRPLRIHWLPIAFLESDFGRTPQSTPLELTIVSRPIECFIVTTLTS